MNPPFFLPLASPPLVFDDILTSPIKAGRGLRGCGKRKSDSLVQASSHSLGSAHNRETRRFPDLALVSIFIFKLLLDMSSRNKMDGMRNAKCEMRDARCEMLVRLYRREPAGAPGEVP